MARVNTRFRAWMKRVWGYKEVRGDVKSRLEVADDMAL